MKMMYIDCSMGAAGDMLMGALFDLLSEEEKEVFLKQINSMGLDGLDIQAKADTKCGIVGIHMQVLVNGVEELQDTVHKNEGKHHHHTLTEVEGIIDNLRISNRVKEDAKAIYKMIAQAESKVHGMDVGEIHFHEVGKKDAIADVVGCAMLMEMIHPEQIMISPIRVGFGTVKCAHGILPVPAPATALILEKKPIYAGELQGEFCTPTGAAILSYYGTDYGNMPMMSMEAIGYGTGNKSFPQANVVRIILGEPLADNRAMGKSEDVIIELSCNIDDMTPEEMGYACECLLQAGARDVYTTAVGMKKNRPGILLTVITTEQDKEKMARLIFAHTTTIGIRENTFNRMILQRETETVKFSLGNVQVKHSYGYGVDKYKVEYEDLKRIAEETNLTLLEVKKILFEEEGLL